ncbi:MAG: WD40 repeat domain-containing protein [Planctomycetes bacterium]|nr:WD40 repeat domain-containing protein [Planctomycetota bacterium]
MRSRRAALRARLVVPLAFLCALPGPSPLPPACWGDPPPAIEIPVFCPAIYADDEERTEHPFERGDQPVLVVRARVPADEPDEEQPFEAQVEAVLFGSWTPPTLRFSYPWKFLAGKRWILALVPGARSEDGDFLLRYHLDAGEESAVRALYEARMDFNVLTATSIVMGKETAVIDSEQGIARVEVLHILHGAAPCPGELIRVNQPHPRERRETWTPGDAGNAIYFLGKPYQDRHLAKGETTYPTLWRLPTVMEAVIHAALARAGTHPLIDVGKPGSLRRAREVMFRGDAGQAIALLGAESDGAVALGARALLHVGAAAIPPVVAAIRTDLLEFQARGPRGYRRLHNLIRLLGQLEVAKDAAVPELHGLIATYLADVAEGAPEPPPTRRQDAQWIAYWHGEQNQEDVNHALAWLLIAVGEESAVTRYGADLIMLRENARGRWRDELQVALDAVRATDTLELQAALARTAGLRPVRSQSGLRHPGISALTFSADGKHLATGSSEHGVRLWNTADWSLARAVPLAERVTQVRYSPDGRLLVVTSGASAGLSSVDVASGSVCELLSAPWRELPALEVSADGTTLVNWGYDGEVRVWDAGTLRERPAFRRTKPEGARGSTRALAADASMFLEAGGTQEAVVRRVGEPRGELGRFTLDGDLRAAVFLPGGRELITATSRLDESTGFEEVVSLQCRRLGSAQVLSTSPGFACTRIERLLPSPDGRLLALAENEGTLRLYRLPDLSEMKVFRGSGVTDGIEDLAFTPDGKLLALARRGWGAPQFIRSADLAYLWPLAGHAADIEEVRFPAGGKTVRTFAADGTSCLWDAATLHLLSSCSIPFGCAASSIRAPDGAFAICVDRALVREGQFASGITASAQVFDVEKAAVVAAVTLPVPMTIHWLSDHEILWQTRAWESPSFYPIWYRLEIPSARILAQGRGDWGGQGNLSEDGAVRFALDGGGKSTHVELKRTDVATERTTVVGRAELPAFTGNSMGLIPGGKYCYIGDPGMYVFERSDLRAVSQNRFGGAELLSLAFTADGERYAAATGERKFIDNNLQPHDSKRATVLRIIETRTGRLLTALRASSRWVKVYFTPDGRQLVVCNDDGTLERWDLPD